MNTQPHQNSARPGLKSRLAAVGPAIIVTGSFIGPGTIATATKSGAENGYSLLWVVVFSIIAAITLQEMAARLGVVSREGIAEAILKISPHKPVKYGLALLVGIALPLGAIAYMGGDLTGSAAGLSIMTGISSKILAPLIGLTIMAIVVFGNIVFIERLLIVLVAIMALVFIVSMYYVSPDMEAVLAGLVPDVTNIDWPLVVALIGTTIVPYNLFIHAINSRKFFHGEGALAKSRWDTAISMTIGGVVTAAILITAATVMFGNDVISVLQLADPLRPLLGDGAEIFLAFGMVAAGLSSAIITPLGASYIIAGLLGWKYDKSDKRFTAVNIAVLVFGMLVAATSFDPVALIVSAQLFGGIVLPIVVVLLVFITSRPRFLGQYVNGWLSLSCGVLVTLLTIYLGFQGVIAALT